MRILLSVLVCLISTLVRAQPDVVVYGVVKDMGTRERLAGITAVANDLPAVFISQNEKQQQQRINSTL
ncbi:MAG TPA: hypothetical protein PKY96_07550, partial [Flavobacteriales bacterium]|nr:hypothetical protein [Flavobacteriales bacterium]